MSEIDIVAALDGPFPNVVVEAKFNALKKLHDSKLSALMTSIEALRKENEKLKVLGKDSKRTQMIQNLKTKIKNQELISDFLKQELVQQDSETKSGLGEEEARKFKSLEEVNSYIIKKTLGGPKRFRPLTREELEKKVQESEKSISKMTKKITIFEGELKRSQSLLVTAPEVKDIAEAKGTRQTTGAETKAGSKIDDMRVVKLTDQVKKLESLLTLREQEVSSCRSEITQLKIKAANIKADEEALRCKEKSYNEMVEIYERMNDELNDSSRLLAVAQEEVNQVRLDKDAELEAQREVIDRLNSRYETIMNQHSSVLSEVHKIEASSKEIDDTLSDPIPPMRIAKQTDEQSSLTAKQTKIYKQKILNLQQKLAESEAKLRDLQDEQKKNAVLTENLRSKNEMIKDLKRTISEMSKRSESTTGSNVERVRGSSEKLVANLYDEINRLNAKIDWLQRPSAGNPGTSKLRDLESRLQVVEAEKVDLIEELKDLQSRGVGSEGFFGMCRFADAVVVGLNEILGTIRGKIELSDGVYFSMEDIRSGGESVLKLGVECVDHAKIRDLLSTIESHFGSKDNDIPLGDDDNDDGSPFHNLSD